jgi:serine/threonine-protein kinase
MTNHEDTFDIRNSLPSDLDPTLTYIPDIRSTVSVSTESNDVSGGLTQYLLPNLSINSYGAEGAQAVSDFLVEYQVGKGGIGQVDAAKQLCFNRMVAIKRVRSDRGSLHAQQQLEKEARVMGQLEHPAIPPVHFVGLDIDGQTTLVMKFIEGKSWLEIINKEFVTAVRQKLPMWYIEKNLNYFIRVGEALEFAHQKPIIHRDIKPANVVMGSYGEVYLIDWGLALELDSGTKLKDQRYVGTPSYAAPEMLGANPTWDMRSDVYLMGGLLFHILSGSPPHNGEDINDLFYRINKYPTPELCDNVPAGLREICARAMEKDPGNRYSSVHALIEDVRFFITHGRMAELYSNASEDLSQIEDMLESGISSSDEFELVGARCRFRLEELSQNWPENVRVKGKLRNCLKLLTDDALQKSRLASARALLKQYGDLTDKETDTWIQEMNARIERLANQLVSRTDELGIGIQSMLVEELAAQKKAYDDLLAAYAKLQKKVIE